MKNNIKAVVVAAVLSALFLSCAKKDDGDPVALIVDGETITMSQVAEAAEFFRRQQMILMPEKIFDAGDGELRRGAARQLAANLLMIKNVGERGWTVDSAKVDAMVERFIAQFPDRDIFMAQLAAMGESEETMRKGMAEEVLLDSLLSMVSASADSVSDEEARAFYDKNQKSYEAPGRARASHIIFPVEMSFDTAQVRQTMEKANEVLAKARAGEDFDKLIREYSSEPNHGDMGWFKKGDLIPDLEHVIFSMKKDGVSDLVPSSMGIHIIKKTDEEPPRQMPYEEAGETIRKTLDFRKKGNRVNEFVDSLLLAADIKYADASLAFDLKSNRGEDATTTAEEFSPPLP